MEKDNFHIPVLSHEAVSFLLYKRHGDLTIVDGTLGGGGYTNLICENTGGNCKVISIDKDLEAIEHSGNKLKRFSNRITYINGNFGEIKEILGQLKIKNIFGLVLDLGLSSYQLESEEGFSFMKNTGLDMRAYKKDELTASEILNTFSRKELSEIFESYGDIGNARRLTEAITERRKIRKFKTTFDLTELIKDEYKISRKNETDFLAKIFQALRIRVNNELENLEKVLNDSLDLLEIGGRIVIVSYHSLEDRIVKNFFKENSKNFKAGDNPFFEERTVPKLKILTKKPVTPSAEEIRQNSRSRSAKLRAAERV